MFLSDSRKVWPFLVSSRARSLVQCDYDSRCENGVAPEAYAECCAAYHWQWAVKRNKNGDTGTCSEWQVGWRCEVRWYSIDIYLLIDDVISPVQLLSGVICPRGWPTQGSFVNRGLLRGHLPQGLICQLR
jgi:hypothetical protein